MRKSIFGATLLAVLASSAHASELRGSLEPEYADQNWSGVYVGISAGPTWLEDQDDRLLPLAPLGIPDKGKASGVSVGVHAGYNFAWNNFVVGVEGDVFRLNERIDNTPIFVPGAPLFVPGALTSEIFPPITVDEIASARARLGYAFGPVMGYVTGGLSYANTSIGLDDFGYVLGAGIDYAVTQNLIAGVQYQHHVFEDFDDQPLDADVDMVVGRISYKF